jgi:formate-dependent nitrite reductase membrane component NrfD
MYPERQNDWNWQIASAVFLGGAGGGAFIISFVLGLMGYEDVARIGTIVGPVLVGCCALFLVSHLFLFNRLGSSWMSRGTFFISAFIILGFIYSIVSFWIPSWQIAESPGLIIGVLASIFAFLVTLYTGCLFGVLRRVPLWNTPALPLLFIFSALSTGMAVVILINYFLGTSTSAEDLLNAVAPVEIGIIILEIVVLGVYLEIIRQTNAIGSQSVRVLLNPTFIVTVIFIGLIIPLAFLSTSGIGGQEIVSPVINSLLVLVGGWFLRYNIVKAGVLPGLAPA